MTKKLRQFLAILGSSFSGVIAAPVGNPSSPAVLEEGFFISAPRWFCMKGGISGEILLNKRLTASSESQHLGISNPEVNWKLAICDIGWALHERIDLHVLAGPVGASNLHWQQKGASYNASADQGLFWGSSANVILFDVEL